MLQPSSIVARRCSNGVLLILAGYLCDRTPVTAGIASPSLAKSEVPS